LNLEAPMTRAYKKKCDEVAARGYEGFRLGVGVEEQRFAAN
jgi:hypothetical protein